MSRQLDLNTVQSVFQLADKNHDGFIDREELEDIFRHLGLPREEAAILLASCDGDQDGRIVLSEWLAWVFQSPPEVMASLLQFDASPNTCERIKVTIVSLNGEERCMEIGCTEPLRALLDRAAEGLTSEQAANMMLMLGDVTFDSTREAETLEALGLSTGAHLQRVILSETRPVEGAMIVDMRGDSLVLVSESSTRELVFDISRFQLPDCFHHSNKLGQLESQQESLDKAAALLSGEKAYFVVEMAASSGAALCGVILRSRQMIEADSSKWHFFLVSPSSPACVPLLLGGRLGPTVSMLNLNCVLSVDVGGDPFTFVDSADWYALGNFAASSVACSTPFGKASGFQHAIDELLDPVYEAFERRDHFGQAGFIENGLDSAYFLGMSEKVKDDMSHVIRDVPERGKVGRGGNLRERLDMFLRFYSGPSTSVKSVHVVACGPRGEQFASRIKGSLLGPKIHVHLPSWVSEFLQGESQQSEDADAHADLFLWIWDGDVYSEELVSSCITFDMATRSRARPGAKHMLFLAPSICNKSSATTVCLSLAGVRQQMDVVILVDNQDDGLAFIEQIFCASDFDACKVFYQLVGKSPNLFCIHRGEEAPRRCSSVSSFSWGVSPSDLADSAQLACESYFDMKELCVFGVPLPPSASEAFTLSLDEAVVSMLRQWCPISVETSDVEVCDQFIALDVESYHEVVSGELEPETIYEAAEDYLALMKNIGGLKEC